MGKRMMALSLLLMLVAAVVWAGDMQKGAAAPTMESMKAEMLKCAVCKSFGQRMDVIGPMGVEAVQLNDGVQFRHWVKGNDPKSLEAFHAACHDCSKTGQESLEWTDDQAKSNLCGFCQGIRSAVKAGGRISKGMTKNAEIMVITSPDAAVQAQLTELQKQCEMMAAMMEPSSGKASAEK